MANKTVSGFFWMTQDMGNVETRASGSAARKNPGKNVTMTVVLLFSADRAGHHELYTYWGPGRVEKCGGCSRGATPLTWTMR